MQDKIHSWHVLLENTPGEKFALYHSDSTEFASALFAAWMMKKIIYLPNNNLKNTYKSLEKHVDGFLGEEGLMPEQISENYNYNIKDIFKHDYQGLVIYTSGSTGEPQAVPKYLSQLKREVETLDNLFGNLVGTNVEIISTISHEHIYGLLFKILWLSGRHSAGAKECVLISGPAHLKRLPNNFITKPVRAIFSSGGALPPGTVLFGKAPIEVYGSTETGGIAWRQQTQRWTPMPGVKWRVGENNLLEISSPHLADNYWYTTADQISVIDNNYFILKSRADRIVKIEGTRISLDLIERNLKQSEWVTDVKALMLDKNNSRQRIAVFIILSQEGKNNLLKLGKYNLNKLLNENLVHSVVRIAWPRVWRYLDEFPVNKFGKTTEAELKALLPVVIEIDIPEDLIYFQGHFPGAPILPGVVQVDWAINYGREIFDLPKSFLGIQKLKFQKVIRPTMKINLELFYESQKSLINFRFYSSEGQHASGSILFGP